MLFYFYILVVWLLIALANNIYSHLQTDTENKPRVLHSLQSSTITIITTVRVLQPKHISHRRYSPQHTTSQCLQMSKFVGADSLLHATRLQKPDHCQADWHTMRFSLVVRCRSECDVPGTLYIFVQKKSFKGRKADCCASWKVLCRNILHADKLFTSWEADPRMLQRP